MSTDHGFVPMKPKLPQPLTMKVKEVQYIMDLSRSGAYNLCSSNKFKIKRIGKRGIRVDRESFFHWYKSQ